MLPHAFPLTEPCTNNVEEYNALLIGMKIAYEIGVQKLEVYGDSILIVNQVRGEFEIHHEDSVPNHIAAIQLVKKFKIFCIEHVLCCRNEPADTLTSFADPER